MIGDPGELPEGECTVDCESFQDCPQPDPDLSMGICTNEGRCRTIARPPRLIVLEPETDTFYPEGTREIRVSGEVETAASKVNVVVTPSAANECAGGSVRAVSVDNPNPGKYATLPFVLDRVTLDPGKTNLIVEASVGGAKKSTIVGVEVLCPGCAEVSLDEPKRRASVPGLELGELRGTVQPPVVDAAIWRVFSYAGDVLDGTMAVDSGRFSVERVPLFPGLNRVEVVVSGIGSGLGESRCSAIISSGTTTEKGLRTILLWDGRSSDLDLHIIGPGGRFGDPGTSLSIRGQRPFFGGSIEDDSNGFGPEVARIESLVDGVYGVIVEPVIDGGDFGSDALVRLLFDGRPLVPGPIGPQHLTSLEGKLWVAGTVRVTAGAAEWRLISQLVSAANPPVTAPDVWPQFQ